MIRLGIFTDAHYAEELTLLGTRTCGKSLAKVRKVVDSLWNEADCFVQLGDLINACGDSERDMNNIRAMQQVLSGCGKPVYSVLGNHDVEAAEKSVFLPDCGGYYAFDLENVRFVALDANYTSAGVSYEDAEWDWTDSLIPEEELNWLRETLASAPGKAVVLCHQNLDDRPGDPHVVRNAAVVRRVLEESGKVLAVLQGHCHSGERSICGGIPYYTFRALCEKDGVPCALATIAEGRILVEERELVKE